MTGSTKAEDVDKYPFRPSSIKDSIADLIDLI
jgi:NagD protein